MSHDRVVELVRREVDPTEYERIRDLWKKHSIAEDARDIAGLMSTLTDDCVYELVPAGKVWRGKAGATAFYTELLSAFPDIRFELSNIVIGPQGVCEEANVTGTHRGTWLGRRGEGNRVEFRVVIFFPWDAAAQKFSGERIYVSPESLLLGEPGGLSFGALDA